MMNDTVFVTYGFVNSLISKCSICEVIEKMNLISNYAIIDCGGVW